jgi:isopentenyl-diphosphate delta-isomerase type 1
MNTELFPLVDENGNITGKATRTECHNGSFLLHPVVHLHILNSEGELLLQKRAETKDTQPGKWDTAVGGHVDYGETVTEALFRETQEELNIQSFSPVFIVRYKYTSDVEAELVHSFYATYNEEIHPDPVEITEAKFWSLEAITAMIGKGVFTPNFEYEFEMYLNAILIKQKG